MVVVRESPRAKISPDKSTTQWPPKSPFQALLSSPSGRKKWREYRDRSLERSPSPSPRKNTVRDAAALQAMSVASSGDEGDEEDEETLQLKLAEIQAKLKLKKLQRKGNAAGSSQEQNDAGGRSSGMRQRSRSPQKRSERPVARSPEPAGQRERATARARTLAPSAMNVDSGVEVPLSPARDRIESQQQMSPARRRLGLSAAAKASDVSLKRARDGTNLARANSGRASRVDVEPAKPKISFSDRLKQHKSESADLEAKQDRIERTRNAGFDRNVNTPSSGRAATVRERPRPDSEVPVWRPLSAHATQAGATTQTPNGVARSQSTKSARPVQADRPREANGQTTSRSRSRADSRPTDEDDAGSPGFDPFSQTNLSKRNIPHVDMARALDGKEVYTLPRLLKEVKAPHYDPPDCESDFVVFAILASKSSPFDQKAAHRTDDEHKPQEDAEKPRNKFMVFHLTDLKWEVDLFLFGSGFDQFWKLTPGTLIAILNPGVMPPKGNRDTGRFSLKLGSSEDCVMEVGVARDLGYCSSVKKDGTTCGAWIDKRSTEICEFHLNLMIDRGRKHRMEVNSMHRPHQPGGAASRHKINSHARAEGGFDRAMQKNQRGGANSRYSREYGQLYSVHGGSNAANLLDAEDKVVLDEEQSRKRIAAAQRERDLARKLGAMGDSVGSEYMRAKEDGDGASLGGRPRPGGGGGSSGQTPYFEKPSVSSLGLLGKKASEQDLAPAKDRKRHFGTGAISSAGTEAMGWGGARKSGLLQQAQPRRERLGSPEKGQRVLGEVGVGGGRPGIVRNRSEEGSLSPKKRARFQLKDKGIREPGRESLGLELRGGVGGGGVAEEDEELDIVV